MFFWSQQRRRPGGTDRKKKQNKRGSATRRFDKHGTTSHKDGGGHTHTHTHTHTHKNVTDAGIDAAVAVSDVVDFQQALFGEIGPVGGGVQDAVVLHPGDPRPTKSRTVQSRKRERERERERASSE